MNQAERAGRELRAMDDLAAQDSFLHRLSPLSKLFVTIFYLAVVVSFPRYWLTALVWMALFPVAGYQLAGIALRTCFQKLRLVLPLVCAVGLLNPIFDRQIVTQIGTLAVSGGVVSMLTLVMKGVFCLLASFLLMATTTIEEICRALRQLHLPETKLIASHDLDLVLETCSRVLLLAGGRLAADGAAGEILRDRTLLEENGLELPLCLAGVPDGI